MSSVQRQANNFNWHFAASNWWTEEQWQEAPSDATDIHCRSGKNSDTPLHVAAATGNRIACANLIHRGAWTSTKNANNIAPYEMIKASGMDLKDVYRAPHVPTHSITKIINEFIPAPATSASRPFTYPAYSDSFGRIIDKLLVQKPESQGSRVVKDLLVLAANLGIEIVQTKCTYYPRDSWMHTSTGKIVQAFCLLLPANHRLLIFLHSYLNYSEASALHPYSRFRFLGGAAGLNYYKEACADWGVVRDRLTTKTSAYVEGGYLLLAPNKRGELRLLVDKQLVNLNVLYNGFKDVSRLFTANIPPLITTTEYTSQLTAKRHRQMFGLGLLGDTELSNETCLRKLVDLQASHFSAGKNTSTIELLEKTYPQLAYRPNSETYNKDSTKVARYIHERRSIKESIARTFGLEVSEMKTLPTILGHLDLCMMPGPKGKMFVIDFKITKKLLKKALQNSDDFPFSDEDRYLLGKYLENTKKAAIALKPVIDKLHKRIADAGFEVIHTPGFFIDVDLTSISRIPKSVNFFNALTGWSEKTQRFYYIVGGATVGGNNQKWQSHESMNHYKKQKVQKQTNAENEKAQNNIGRLFMDIFAAFLKRHVPTIDIFYIGHTANNPNNFQAPMFNMNHSYFGLHCITFPLECREHTV